MVVLAPSEVSVQFVQAPFAMLVVALCVPTPQVGEAVTALVSRALDELSAALAELVPLLSE
jgi:hypothetical protein